MYKEHPDFNPPPENAVLWRYMDFTKFVSLLEKSAIFFTRADKLEDSFEGYWPNVNRAAVRQSLASSSHRVQLEQTWLNLVQECPRFTLISCWHESRHESAAMWKLYSKGDSGIAIKTEFDSFAKCFSSSEDIQIGRVNYVNHETDFFTSSSLFSPYLCKRKSFEHECEVRAIIQTFPSREDKEKNQKLIDLSQDICEVGIYYEVDLSLLIQEVIVGPYAPDWLLELIRSVASRYSLLAPVVKSSLADSPSWEW